MGHAGIFLGCYTFPSMHLIESFYKAGMHKVNRQADTDPTMPLLGLPSEPKTEVLICLKKKQKSNESLKLLNSRISLTFIQITAHSLLLKACHQHIKFSAIYWDTQVFCFSKI